MGQAAVSELLEAVPWAAAVGGSLVAGALVASVTEMRARITAAVTVFGGGALLAAVAFDVVPRADREAGLAWTAAGIVGRWFALALLSGIALALAVATLAGSLLPEDFSETITGTGAAIAAGAILATVAISIIPDAFKKVSRLAAVVATLGFVTGYLLS